MERKKFCPNKETLTTSLKGKLTVLFKEDAQFKQDYLKRSLNWTEESAVHETGMQLQSQRMGLYQANQLIDRARREKSWLCDESKMRSRAIQEDRARNCQEILEFRRISCTEADRGRQLRSDGLSAQKEESKLSVNQLMVQMQELQGRVNSLVRCTSIL